MVHLPQCLALKSTQPTESHSASSSSSLAFENMWNHQLMSTADEQTLKIDAGYPLISDDLVVSEIGTSYLLKLVGSLKQD